MRIISLFSGAGGFDLGLVNAGHEIVWANDVDADCVRTYNLNISKNVILADIESISSFDIPQADVVIGGFPCQGFSQANLRRSAEDSRNKLYTHFLRVVREKMPNYFLAENVRGILSLAKGAAIQSIIQDFELVGYRVNVRVFNMADFGVPQSRIRVIIAGTRCELSSECEFGFPQPTHSKYSDTDGFQPWVSISKALSGIPDPDKFPKALPNQHYSQYKITNRNFTGHRTTDPDKPSPTILARGNGKGGVCAIQHPKNHRRLSVRECAIIQTFPERFEFFGSMSSCYRQVGNAVPVRFAHLLGLQLESCKRKLAKCA